MSGSDPASGGRSGSPAPLASGALAAAAAGVVLGFTLLPQLLALALGGLSLAREPGGRRRAGLAIAAALALTVFWAVVLGLAVKWWAATRS